MGRVWVEGHTQSYFVLAGHPESSFWVDIATRRKTWNDAPTKEASHFLLHHHHKGSNYFNKAKYFCEDFCKYACACKQSSDKCLLVSWGTWDFNLLPWMQLVMKLFFILHGLPGILLLWSCNPPAQKMTIFLRFLHQNKLEILQDYIKDHGVASYTYLEV